MARLKVKQMAEERGWTAARLARRADLSYQTVANLWKNPEKDVSLSTLGKIAAVLGVQVPELIEIKKEEHEQESR